MTLNSHNLLSSRVPVTDYGNLTADRYQFLGLNQAEPNLGPGADNTVLTITTGNTRAWANSISLTGNIGGNYILGNGYFLTGIQTTGSLITNQTLIGDGTTTNYNLNVATTTANAVLITTNGLAQTPGVDYTVTGNTVTFTTAPAQGDVMQVRFLGNNIVSVTTTYNNSNVAAFLPTYTGNLAGVGLTLTNNIGSAIGTVEQITADGMSIAPNNPGVMLQVTGQVGTPTRIYIDGANTYAAYVGRSYGGTTASPSQILSGSIMSRFAATPYTNSGWANISTTRIDMVATENQTATSQGSAINFVVTRSGTATITSVAQITGTGLNVNGNVVGGNINTGNNISAGGNVFSANLYKNSVLNIGTTLPTASAAGAGARAFVNNANTVNFYDVVGSGGSNTVPVWSDGVDWRVG